MSFSQEMHARNTLIRRHTLKGNERRSKRDVYMVLIYLNNNLWVFINPPPKVCISILFTCALQYSCREWNTANRFIFPFIISEKGNWVYIINSKKLVNCMYRYIYRSPCTYTLHIKLNEASYMEDVRDCSDIVTHTSTTIISRIACNHRIDQSVVN